MNAPTKTSDPARTARRAARDVGLRYARDTGPGIRRVRAGKGFHYIRPNGGAVRDRATLTRIRRLAVPPAWTDVWISPDPHGHIQATGRDARGRKQYRYHDDWRASRDGTKYDNMLAFAKALPKIRARVAKDLRRRGLPREKVLATIVRLLETTYMRVGNDEYRRSNGSHGLTTLQDKHARVGRARVAFAFEGKSGKSHDIAVNDARLARIVKACQDLPGQELFQYVDEDGEVRDVGSADVNAYLRDVTGGAFTAKDFRTWAGTMLAADALRAVESKRKGRGKGKDARGKSGVTAAIAMVAQHLGNTPVVCRKSYVHPDLLAAYLDGELAKPTRARGGLRADEAAVVALLRRRAREGPDARLRRQLAATARRGGRG